MVEVKVDKEKCVGCGTCVETCPVGLYSMNDEKAVFTGDVGECVVCRACEASCPVEAIEVAE